MQKKEKLLNAGWRNSVVTGVPVHTTGVGNQSSGNTVEGAPFTVRAVFKYDTSPVEVLNPVLRIFSVDNGEALVWDAVDSLPTDSTRTAWALNLISDVAAYSITIDPLSIGAGKFRLQFSGSVVSGSKHVPLVIEGVIGVGELSRAQLLVNRALEMLADFPEEYLFKKQVHQWRASSLLKYLDDGVSWFNALRPTTSGYTIETLPPELDSLMVRYVKACALFARARLGIENDVTVNDTRSVSVETFSKYKAMYDTEMTECLKLGEGWKFSKRPSPYAIARSRYPVYFSRILSMIPNFQNTFVSSIESRANIA